MGRGGPESQSRPPIQLKDNEIFIGPDGIAFTPYGSTLQKIILLYANTLGIAENGNIKKSPFKKSHLRIVKQEWSSLCRENGIPSDPAVMRDLNAQLRRLTEVRMDVPRKAFFATFGTNGNNIK